ncbi:S8 family peptidase [Tenacibaculum jejuense]|uniref:S8 family peptidase n=1 Tax=Tenacibaculum jejuense TaxID=584609 RepID=UPI0012FDA63C|nr:S8 family peptidase [Tenacibaculum jejuense]
MNTKKQQNKKPRVKLLLVFLVFAVHISHIKSQNLKEVKYAEALQILKKTEVPKRIPVIAILDAPIQLELFDENIIWKNSEEIPGNEIDDDKNGYIDDVFGWNFSDHSNDVTNKNFGNWHGTPVFSIIKSFLHQKLAKQRLVKVMSLVKGNSIQEIEESLAYILEMRKRYNETNGKEGAFIVAVNCSWGKNGLWNYNNKQWCSYYDLLGEQGVLVVSSVPNEDVNVDQIGDMPSTCLSDFLLTVTNIHNESSGLEYAAFGEESVDIAAPGERSFTLLNSGDFGFFDGTSAAAPYVTSAIGLMYQMYFEDFDNDIQENPKKVALSIKDFILKGIDKIDFLQDKTTSGGSLNMYNSIKLFYDYYNKESKMDQITLDFVSLYPNPSDDYVHALVESNIEEEAYLNIFDLHGRRIRREKFQLKTGVYSYEFYDVIFQLTRNIYMITIDTASGRFSKSVKFIKK